MPHPKLKIPIGIISLLFCTAALYSQGTGSNSQQQVFDKTIGRKNLSFNNGTIHKNNFRSIDDTHRYYGKNNYYSGDVFYDGQLYQNLQLKYDLTTDILVIKLDGENNKAGFNAVSDKIDYFIIDNKKFRYLDTAKHPDFVKGFYEELLIGETILYTKYYKDRIEVLTNQSVFNKYYDKNDFIVYYQDQWFKFNSEREVAEIFPQAKNSIADFYQMNSTLEKSDKRQFARNLLAHINNFLRTAK